MPYDFETYRPNGSIAMNGSNKAGIFVESFTFWYAYGQSAGSGSRVYTNIPAGSLFFVIVTSGGQYTFTAGDDGLGHAQINWTYSSFGSGGFILNNTSDTVVLVFAKKLIQPALYTMIASNSDGDQLTDYNYKVPQYAGTIQPDATPSYSFYETEFSPGYVAHRHIFQVSLKPGTNRMLMLNLPDSSTDDAWYYCTSFIGANYSTYHDGAYHFDEVYAELIIMRKTATAYRQYKVPTVHVFCLDGPLSGGDLVAIKFWKPDGTMVYDSSAENITIRDQKYLTYPARYDPASTMALSMATQAGVVIPQYGQTLYYDMPPDINGNDVELQKWLGFVQRKGGNLSYQLRCYSVDRTHGGNTFDTQFGVASGNCVMSVDLAQLSPSYVIGNSPAYL